ncbi:MAG: tRNA (guanosine(46)-N7)-methyltransferase TrmB [Microcystaceae cyanobacterium]
MARVRVRQHVNPLSLKYRTPIVPLVWDQIYETLDQPLHLDIGCARGKFLLQMAHLYPKINFLGVEIRKPLVIEANQKKEELGLTNLQFLFGNINIEPHCLFESFPKSQLKTISIQFPDPWFKQRHIKRRVVQPDLVDAIAKYIAQDGIIFLQSDIKAVAQQMTDYFSQHPQFIKQYSSQWLAENPFPIATEREIMTLNNNEPVYRSLFQVKDND